MEHKSDVVSKIKKLKQINKAYHEDAYRFVLEGLEFTIARLTKTRHVSGQELLEGLRDYAVQQYGPMARTVLEHWGVKKTLDFGTIVFDLVEAELLKKTEDDALSDFEKGYEFSEAFGQTLQFPETE